MNRWKLTIEYDGTGFVGWQLQPSGLSVQGVLEAAVLAFSGETVRVAGAGRTDAGVHALGQVAHVDISRASEPAQVRDALNAHLRPHPVSVLAAELVDPSFDARLSAIGRRYRYRILNRRAPPTLERHGVWHVMRPLDVEAMAEAARRLLGRHDFSTFRASLCQAKSPIRTLDRLDVLRDGESVRFEVAARSFLHHQVRNMVGTLCLVGHGRWSAEDVAAALAARSRAAGGPTAPASGLVLVGVDYPEPLSAASPG